MAETFRKVRIKLLQGMAGPGNPAGDNERFPKGSFAFTPGQIIDWDEQDAKKLVAAGHAEFPEAKK